MKIKVFLLLLSFLLASCGVHKSKEVTIEPDAPTQTNDYQIGDEWSLKLDGQSDLENSVFRIQSLDNNKEGVAFFIGKAQETYLFITNSHIVDQYIDLCNSNVLMKNQSSEIVFTCDKFIHTLRQSDISIISMKKVEASNFNTDLLVPLVLSKQRSFDTSEYLKLTTLDTDLNLVSDSSRDCRFLSNTPQIMTDIDLLNPVNGNYLSLPVGCEAAHGQSGSPILSSSGEVKAVLWTGKSPKTFFTSNEILDMTNSNDNRVWTEFNLAVPSYIIYDEILEENHWFETDFEKEVLQNFFQEDIESLNVG